MLSIHQDLSSIMNQVVPLAIAITDDYVLTMYAQLQWPWSCGCLNGRSMTEESQALCFEITSRGLPTCFAPRIGDCLRILKLALATRTSMFARSNLCIGSKRATLGHIAAVNSEFNINPFLLGYDAAK